MERQISSVIGSIVGVLLLLPAMAVGQPGGPPEWIAKADPAKYVLLAKDIKPPFAWGTSPEVQAESQSVGIKDVRGQVAEQTMFFMYATQTVKLAQPLTNTAATKPPTP
ncbi:MAG: hypothetical protein KKI08_00510, partial [Armatimonadetes bacterium]|nr:hypothetical protein [Armatimonadota bacterium]